MTLERGTFNKCGDFFFFGWFASEAILPAILSVEKGFSAHLMTRSFTIFGQSRVMPTEQGYDLRTLRIHCDEGLTLETSVFESFTVANLP